MPKPITRFDAASVRDSWNRAAGAFAEGQASGVDYYRFDFFGPAQIDMCGDVTGLNLLDVGCGNGYLSREMSRRGAHVTGIDISPAMIEQAARFEPVAHFGVRYHVGDAANLAEMFAAESFDMATSCMALADMPEPARVLRSVSAVLRAGGRFVCSIPHPCTDTPHRIWERDDQGAKRWLQIDRYFERGPLEYTWNGWSYTFATPALHAPLEDWIGWIVAAGFEVHGLREPYPTQEALRAHPDLEDAARVPYFLIFDLVRSADRPATVREPSARATSET